MTTLYRALYDESTGHLFLFSEFVDDPRFGSSLDELDLTLLREFAGLEGRMQQAVGEHIQE